MAEVAQSDLELATALLSHIRGYGVKIYPEHYAVKMVAEYRIAAEARAYAAAKAQAAGVARDAAYPYAGLREGVMMDRIAVAIEAMEPTDDND